jgi:hypothetical protein
MSLLIATQAELLKTKRTASFWFSILGAALIPVVLFIALLTDADAAKNLAKDPWDMFLKMGWQILSVFILPMYIILVTTLITQIEYKNNTWKQVYSSPQSITNIFFAKFLTIQLMIIFCCLLFNVLMFLAAVMGNLINTGFTFFERSIDWPMLLRLNARTYISILGISVIQYWLSLRFKNFIVPVGIGLALVIGSIIAFNYHWEHIYKYPYAFAGLTFDSVENGRRPFLENHELNSMGYLVSFIVLGLLDLKMRKEKG